MKNLYDKAVLEEVTQRINSLSTSSTNLWGKMNVGQMLAHCKEAFKVPLADKPVPRMVSGYFFGWIVKKKLFDDSPTRKNLPTAPNFMITDERDFNKEKEALLFLISEFNRRGPGDTGKFPHPFFGKLSQEEWGKGMYKHLDHHLQQFGV